MVQYGYTCKGMLRAMNFMTDGRNPDVWNMIFEQTPTVLRWVMGILTLGIFTLASILYKWHREDMERVRRQQREDMDHTRESLRRVHSEIGKVRDQVTSSHTTLYQLLVDQNTRRDHRREAQE